MLTRKSIVAAFIGLLMLMAGNIYAKGSVQRGGDLTFDCIECHKMDGERRF